MKNLALLSVLLLSLILYSCSKNDEPTQDYTSFMIMQDEIGTQENTVVGYYNQEGLCVKIAALGDLKKGVWSKEIIIPHDTIQHIYVFVGIPKDNIPGTIVTGVIRQNKVIFLEKNKLTRYQITPDTRGIHVDPYNLYEYPH